MITIDLIDENQLLIKTFSIKHGEFDEWVGDLRIFLKVEEEGLRARTLRIGSAESSSTVDENITNSLRSFSDYPWAKSELLKIMKAEE